MRILLIDDHALVREGMAQLLRRVKRGARVLQAGSLFDGLQLASEAPAPELLVLDVMLPDSQGLQGLREFRRRFPALPVLLISAYDEPALRQKALSLGAAGFLSKSASFEQMGQALSRALRPLSTGPRKRSAPGPELLTPRQLQVLGQIGRGQTNPQIAKVLGITHATVRAHALAIFKVLGVKTRTEAAMLAVKQGLIHVQR